MRGYNIGWCGDTDQSKRSSWQTSPVQAAQSSCISGLLVRCTKYRWQQRSVSLTVAPNDLLITKDLESHVPYAHTNQREPCFTLQAQQWHTNLQHLTTINLQHDLPLDNTQEEKPVARSIDNHSNFLNCPPAHIARPPITDLDQPSRSIFARSISSFILSTTAAYGDMVWFGPAVGTHGTGCII